MPRKPLLYPQRQRCFVCRRYWGFSPPLRGLYCSPECAGRPPIPMSEINGVLIPPRTCRRRLKINGPNSKPQVIWKQVYSTREEALASPDGPRHAYECPNCWYWHVAKNVAPHVLAPGTSA